MNSNEPDATAVETALADAAEAQEAVDAAEQQLAEAIAALTDRMVELGGERLAAGLGPDRELIRRLYWLAPRLSAQVLAKAFGLGTVQGLIGTWTARRPCAGCGKELRFEVRNRTHLAKLAGSRCEPCAQVEAERVARLASEHAEWRRKQDQIDREGLEREMEAFVLANPDLPEESDRLYVDIPDSRWGGSTVTTADLHRVKRRLLDRLRPPE